jgi:putative Ca2+/H+ antiporter (TMEM165/GDT1 family)
METGIVATSFWLIFVAELGDKTQLTSMALATRYPWRPVFAGIALAFLLLNVVAVGVGSLLFALVPLVWIKILAGGLFLVFGVMALFPPRGEHDGETARAKPARGPFATSFVLILLAELGDKTQILTATLAAQHPQLSVLVGSTLALWLVSLLGIFVGRELTRHVPLHFIQRCAGVMFLLFGVVTLREAYLLP